MYKKILLSILIFHVYLLGLLADDLIPGEIVVQLNNNVHGNTLEVFINQYSQYDFEEIDILSTRNNIRLFSFNYEIVNPNTFLTIIKNNANVNLAYLNYIPVLIQIEEVSSSQPTPKSIDTDNYVPNDPRFSNQWAHENTGQVYSNEVSIIGNDIAIRETWKLIGTEPRNSRNIVIAVFDRNTWVDHPDLKQNIIEGDPLNDMTPNKDHWYEDNVKVYDAHGSVVSGVIGAVTNNDHEIG
ncbi:MAG: S8 family serine peptidase [Candidatus Cloacimonetes bacterium]|nr:S8 family serine peptidase [Candidatus Cloacimonadota bacterium]